MSHKRERIAGWIEPFLGREYDSHYLGFFECFNRQLFFEAHEVLEELWLAERGPNYAFYKGLIQLAGAFVHLQKGRMGPAAALLRMAATNLGNYPPVYQALDVESVQALIRIWLKRLSSGEPEENFLVISAPKLRLLSEGERKTG